MSRARPRAKQILRGRPSPSRTRTSGGKFRADFAAGTDRARQTAVGVEKADRPAKRFHRPRQRKVGNRWRKIRSCSSREEETRPLPGCSARKLFVRKRNRQEE